MTEIATFGGGCFWCIEAVFEPLRGVESVVSGYAGGRVPNPNYARVCTGATGHAEVVQVRFDPAVISYQEILELFFAFHDPTTRDAQGPDTGPQYRSIILTGSPEQDRVAREVIRDLDAQGVFGAPIVTDVVPLDVFWAAEAEHQHYFQRNPSRAYCAAMIAPKMAKLRRSYASRLRPEPLPGDRR